MSTRGRSAAARELLALWAAAAVVLALVVVDGMLTARPKPSTVTSVGPITSATAGASASARRAEARASAKAEAAKTASGVHGDDLLALLAAATMAGQPSLAALAGTDLTTGAHVAWNSPGFGGTTPAYLASVAKLDIAEMVLLAKADAGQPLTDDEDALIQAMLIQSDNDAAETLYVGLGDDAKRSALNLRLGLAATTLDPQGRWGLTVSTAADQLRLLSNLTGAGGPLSAAAKSYLLTHMGNVADDQDWGVGSVDPQAKLKNGWLPLHGNTDWVITSVGVVTAANGHQVQLVVLSNGWEGKDEGVELSGELAAALLRSLAR